MRTPIDAFHQAMLNLAAQKRAAETPPKRRRQGIRGHVGERVTVRLPANLVHEPGLTQLTHLNGCSGVVDDEADSTVSHPNGAVLVNFTALNRPDISLRYWIPYNCLDAADPVPTTTDLAEIERWLAS